MDKEGFRLFDDLWLEIAELDEDVLGSCTCPVTFRLW